VKIFVLSLFIALAELSSGSAQTPVQVQESQKTAIALYPDLAVARSKFNQRFLELVAAQRASDASFFQKDDWPLLIAQRTAADLGLEVKTKPPLTFTIKSTEIKQSHEYGVALTQKTISAQAGFALFFVTFAIKNESDAPQQFSSERFHVLDKDGKEMSANLIGVGDSFAEPGRVTVIDGKIQNKNKEMIATYKGKLSTPVSFFEWNLMPRQTHSDTLAFVIPSTVKGAHCEFKDAGK